MNSRRVFAATCAFVLPIAAVSFAIASGAPSISIDTPLNNEVFGFSEAVGVSGAVDWGDPGKSGQDTVTITLLCPRDLRIVSQDSYTANYEGGTLDYQGELTTPDGSDPDDVGSFCLVVECDGGKEEINVSVEDTGGGGS